MPAYARIHTIVICIFEKVTQLTFLHFFLKAEGIVIAIRHGTTHHHLTLLS